MGFASAMVLLWWTGIALYVTLMYTVFVCDYSLHDSYRFGCVVVYSHELAISSEQ